MAQYLIKTTEVYRCDSEKEAKDLIESAKQDKSIYTLTKNSSEIRTTKQKGEIVDSWYRVTLTKEFTEEKEPVEHFSVIYNSSASTIVTSGYIEMDEE